MNVPDFVSRLRADEWILIRGSRRREQLAQVLPTSATVRRNGGVKVWKFLEILGKPSRFSDPMRIPFCDIIRRPTSAHDLAAVKRAELHQGRNVETLPPDSPTPGYGADCAVPDTPETVAAKAANARRVGEAFRDALRARGTNG